MIRLLAPPLVATRQAFASDVKVGFSPDRGALELVLRTIDGARTSLYMAAYTFTSRPVADALIKAKKRGVDVRIVVDRIDAKEPYSEEGFLLARGVTVRTDHQYSMTHNKFMVVDGSTVEDDSFNYTWPLRIGTRRMPSYCMMWQLPAKYEREWQRLWAKWR